LCAPSREGCRAADVSGRRARPREEREPGRLRASHSSVVRSLSEGRHRSAVDRKRRNGARATRDSRREQGWSGRGGNPGASVAASRSEQAKRAAEKSAALSFRAETSAKGLTVRRHSSREKLKREARCETPCVE